MNRSQVKGATNRVTGEVKEQVGKAIGDKTLQAKGHAREMKGKLQQKLGNARESLKQDESDLERDRKLDRDIEE